MTILGYDDLASGESIVVRGQLTEVYTGNLGNLSITDPFPENNSVLRSFTNIEIHYHCWNDVDPTTDEADSDGNMAFRVDDWVTILCKIQNRYPNRLLDPIAITGFVGEGRICWKKAVFRTGTTIYLADIEGDPQAGGYNFTNLTSVQFSADDVFILSNGRYWRCLGGLVYTGVVSANGTVTGEVQCTGLGAYSVRALNVWKVGDNYNMIFSDDADLSDEFINSRIVQAQSSDRIAWSSFSIVRSENFCDTTELVQEGYGDADEVEGVGIFDVDDTFALEDISITTGDGSMVLRICRIGKKTFWGGQEAWTALGAVSNGSYGFFYEADFTIEGFGLGGMDILQVI